MLAPIKDEGLGLKIWDPRKNPIDKRDLMPIITPTYPCQNSTYNVTVSTLHIMKQEFTRSAQVCTAITKGEQCFDALFEKQDFFKLHKNFLQIKVTAQSAEELKKWSGFVFSRLRKVSVCVCGVPCYGEFWALGRKFSDNRFLCVCDLYR